MIRYALVLLLLLMACADPVVQPEPELPGTACPTECGPTRLEIRDYEIVWPHGEPVIYSGDTIRVHLDIRNVGPLGTDSLAYAFASIWDAFESRAERLGYVAAGATVRKTITLKMPLVHPDTGGLVDLELSVGNDRVRIEKLPFKATYMQLNGPDTVRVGQEYTYALRIVNPAPQRLLPATIGVCYVYFNCATDVFLRVRGPEVPARSSTEIPLRFTMVAPRYRTLPLFGGAVTACYGWVGVALECGWRQAALLSN